MRRTLRLLTAAACLAGGWIGILACSESEFGGGAQRQSGGRDVDDDDEDNEADQGAATDTGLGTNGSGAGTGTINSGTDGLGTGMVVESDPGSARPTGLVTGEGGISVARPNYDACKALPQSGKRGYGKCQADAAVVIVNDGKAQEMTCCPLGGSNILSANQAELHVQRTGMCQGSEVLTGMVEPHGPTIYCSRINDRHLTLATPVPSQYVTGKAPGVMGEIAGSYNVSDTCICPEGTVALGGHTASDNRCGEQCARITAK